MAKKKKKKTKKKQQEDFGSVEFHCTHCGHSFEVDWETIWDIQEFTHGYVGYHLNDTFISCDKCGEIVNDEEKVDKGKNLPKPVTDDDDLPF